MGSLKAWLYTPDGIFYFSYAFIYLIGFFGLGIALLARYFAKKEAQLKERSQDRYLKKRSKNRYHSQHKSNSEHHV